MLSIADSDAWSGRVHQTLSLYSEPLLRQVAGKLIRPRTNQPVEELLEKSVGTASNPPVIDRRIKDLSVAGRKLLAVIGLSRQPRWKVGHLISILSALGHAEGFAPIQEALEAGLLFPELKGGSVPPAGAALLDDFAAWLGESGTLQATVFAHPLVAGRARAESLDLPNLATAASAASVPRSADGLDWPLRLAAVWQQIDAGSVRLTQANTLFKRDQTRLQSDEVLNAHAVDQLTTIPDPGALSLFWARAVGLLQETDGELKAQPFPESWHGALPNVLTTLFAALPLVESWDPLAGYAPVEAGLAPFPSAATLCLLILANGGKKAPETWFTSAAIATWLWDHHPSWAGTLPPEAHKDHGQSWVEAFLYGIIYPLRLLEVIESPGGTVLPAGASGSAPAGSTVPPNQATKITAFLVTPEMPGFEVLEARAEKCGIRGTATSKLRFTNMRVPKANVLGPIGKGLKVALTVLDFGRTTFGASCTGHAKVCLKAMVEHAKKRVQFQQPLAEFQLVQKKVAFAAAHTFAMEAATLQCAAFIDRGFEDYMLETAILKIFATEHLWTIVNDTIQVWGGKGYFCDQPLERWMRDARINTIGEGANDVLKAFVAVVGCRGPGEYLKGLRDDVMGGRWSLKKLGAAIGVGASLVVPWATTGTPDVPVNSESLRDDAHTLGKLVREFGLKLPHVFLGLKDETKFVQAQLVHERLADIAIDLYVSSCVLSRLDHLMAGSGGTVLPAGATATAQAGSTVPPGFTDPFADVSAGQYFLKLAFRRIRACFLALDENDDAACLQAAKTALTKW